MMATTQTTMAKFSKIKDAKNYFIQKTEKLMNTGKLVFYTTLVIATLAFTVKQAFSQDKNQDSTNAKSDKTEQVKPADKPKPTLLQPISWVSYNRLGPNPYLLPNQALFFTRINYDGTRTTISYLSLAEGGFMGSVNHAEVTKDSNTTTTNGLAIKYTKSSKQLGDAQVSVAGRVASVKDPVGKTSATFDGQVAVYQPFGLPTVAAVGVGTNDNNASISVGSMGNGNASSGWAASATWKENAKAGKSVALGADLNIPYTSSVSQRVYASAERATKSGSIADGTPVVTYIFGSRLFVPFGTFEMDYWAYSNASFWKGDIGIRFTYILN